MSVFPEIDSTWGSHAEPALACNFHVYIHTLHTLYTLHTLHTLYTLHTLDTLHITYITYIA